MAGLTGSTRAQRRHPERFVPVERVYVFTFAGQPHKQVALVATSAAEAEQFARKLQRESTWPNGKLILIGASTARTLDEFDKLVNRAASLTGVKIERELQNG